MKLLDTTQKYISDLDSLERLIEVNEKIIKQQVEEKSQDLSLAELISIVIELKTSEITEQQIEGNEEYNKLITEHLGENGMIDFVYDNLKVELEDDGGVSISSKHQMLSKMLQETLESQVGLDTDISHLQNSIVISLVSSFELLIGNILKEFILEVDQSDFLAKKSINFSKIVGIGSIDEVKSYLVDEFIEELLRGSFKTWINEIENKGNIKISNIDIIKKTDDIELINETFQRRHLLIHNDGIVNDLYLMNVKESCRDKINKGDRIEINKEYIINRISTFRKVGILLIFLFSQKMYRDNRDQFFTHYNSILLKLINKKCKGSRYILEVVSNDTKYSSASRLTAKINYYLSYKLADELNLIIDELEKFDVETLSTEYKMAKHILMGETEKAFTYFKQYIEQSDENDFFHVIDWPLLKIAKKESIFKEYIDDKISTFLKFEKEEVRQ